MKNTLFLIAFLFSASLSNAQNSGFDQRLLSKFSKNELTEMKSKNADTYAYWNFYVANAYQIVDLPAEKTNAHEIKGTVKIPDMSSINIFDLNHIPLKKDYQYYRIEGTNKLLMIISEEQIKEKFSAVKTQ
ncbi:MAG: hypothetical protein V4608_07770 [Bacteroidota bacterium]